MLQALQVACVLVPCVLVGWVVLRMLWVSPQTLLCMDCEQCGRACPLARKSGGAAPTPHEIMVATRADTMDEAVARGALECNSCGACERLCPRGLAPYKEVECWRRREQAPSAVNGEAACVALLLLAVSFVAAGRAAAQEPRPPTPVGPLVPATSGTAPFDIGFTEDVVVTANLTPGPLSESGSAVTVIDRQMLEAFGAQTVAGVMALVPGVSAVQQGGSGRTASVFIRGAVASHTLVMVDGVRVNGVTSGQADFADVSADEIERIEVLRGPQSGMYGSEAIGGAINIVSRRPAPGLHGSAELGAGSFSAWNATATMNHGTLRGGWRLTARRERLPGDSLAAEVAGDRSLHPYERLFAAATGSLKLGESRRIDVSARHTDATSHPDGFTLGAGPSPAPRFVRRHVADTASARLRLQPRSRWTQTFSIGIAHDDLEGDDPDSTMNTFAIDGLLALHVHQRARCSHPRAAAAPPAPLRQPVAAAVPTSARFRRPHPPRSPGSNRRRHAAHG